MSSLNLVQLIGHLGGEPKVYATPTKNMCTFSMATTIIWRDKTTGNKKESTQWHHIVVFRSYIVEMVKNSLHKGSKVYVQGSLRNSKYTDKNGLEKQTSEVIAEKLIFLDKREYSQQQQREYSQQQGIPQEESNQMPLTEEDDIVF